MKKLPDYIKYHIISREDSSRKDAFYLSKLIRRISGAQRKEHFKLLEVACGNGRIHPFMRKRGFSIFGIDNSKELLEEARKKYPKYSRNYLLKDMRKFNIKRKFDVVLSWYTSFGYFDDRTNISILKTMNRHLRKGGLLLIEIPNRISKSKNMTGFLVRKYGNFVEKMYSKIVKTRGQTFWVFKEIFYYKDGKLLKLIEEFTRRIRLYDQEEMKEILKKSGLEFIQAFGTGTFKNVRKNSRRMVIVAKKP